MIFSNIAMYDSDRLPPPDPGDLLLAGPNHNITIHREQDAEYAPELWSGGTVLIKCGTSRLDWLAACDLAGFRRLPDFSVFAWSYRLGGATATLNLNIPTKEQQQ